jgi:acyl carrier protein
MDVLGEVKGVLGEVLSLGDRAQSMTRDTVLLGGIPEFDSMAVVSVIVALEESFGIMVEDDELSAETFETVGSLSDFIASKAGTDDESVGY